MERFNLEAMELFKSKIKRALMVLVFIAGVIFSSSVSSAQTGFFESLGISSTKGSESSYKKVIKPSSKATTDLSYKSVEITGDTGKATYNRSIVPSIEYTVEFSEKSSGFTADSSEESFEFSKKTGNSTYEKSIVPSMDNTLIFSEKTGEFSLNSSEKSFEISMEYSVKPAFEITGKSFDLTLDSFELTDNIGKDYIIPSFYATGAVTSGFFRRSFQVSDYISSVYISNGNITLAVEAGAGLIHRNFQFLCYEILNPTLKNVTDIASISTGAFIAGILYSMDEVISPSFEVASGLSTGLLRLSFNSYESLVEESIKRILKSGLDLSSYLSDALSYSSVLLYEDVISELVESTIDVTKFTSGVSLKSSIFVIREFNDLTENIGDISLYSIGFSYYSGGFIVKESFIDLTKKAVDLSYGSMGATLYGSNFIYEESLYDLAKASVDVASFTSGITLNFSEFSYEELVDISKSLMDFGSISFALSYRGGKFIVEESFINIAKRSVDLSGLALGASKNSTLLTYEDSVVAPLKYAVDASYFVGGISGNTFEVTMDNINDASKYLIDISSVSGGITVLSFELSYNEIIYPSGEFLYESILVSQNHLKDLTRYSYYEIILPFIESSYDLALYLASASGYALLFTFEILVEKPFRYIVLNTIDFSRYSSEMSLEFSENTFVNTAQMTKEKIEISSKESSKVTEKSYDITILKTEKSSKVSTDNSKKSGKNSLNISRETDLFTAETSEKTSFWKTPKKVSPLSADRLINDSFAGKGSTLSFFAKKLNIKEEVLAELVRKNVPKSPTLEELSNILSYVFEGMKQS